MSVAEGRVTAAKDGRDGPSTSSKRTLGPPEAPTMLQSSVDLTSSAPSKSTSMATTATSRDRERKIGHRRVDEATGQVTYKKKTTTDLMRAIQLGIGQSVGSLTSKPERDVLMQDFSVVETVNFPESGSNLTPAHRVGEFKFKTYAPVAFRYFRELFGIQMDDFLVSLCSDTLTELSNPGASGSIFFITEDDEFIIKTVQHKEAEFLQKLLPGYYMNLNQNPRTLLPKFYGLHCYQQGGKNIRFVIMNNLLPSSVALHEKYDLKGSTHKRKASKYELAKPLPTLKDLDFRERHPDGLLLEADMHEALLKTVRRDCRVLESFKIMDYSLLLGVHNIDQVRRERSQMSVTAGRKGSRVGGSQQDASSAAATRAQALAAELMSLPEAPGSAAAAAASGPSVQRNKSVRQRLANFSTAMESIQAEAETSVDLEDDEEATPAGGIPARNVNGDRLLLYVGIIDILQSYRLKKKLEHGFKSIVHDGDTISVHRPGFYAQRFQTFCDKEVFKKLPAPQRSPSRKKLARQRSVTEATQEGLTSGAPGTRPAGLDSSRQGGLSSSRPDLIVAATAHGADASSTATPPAESAAVVSGVEDSRPAADTYHADAKLSPVAGTGVAVKTAHPAFTNENVADSRSQLTTAGSAIRAPGPPVGGDHLPPYSEQPTEAVTTLLKNLPLVGQPSDAATDNDAKVSLPAALQRHGSLNLSDVVSLDQVTVVVQVLHQPPSLATTSSSSFAQSTEDSSKSLMLEPLLEDVPLKS